MKQIDPKMAERVWQRVRAAREDTSVIPELPDLKELIAQLWVDRVLCRQLSRTYRGRDRALLEGIGRQKQDSLARLKGILAMQTGVRTQIPAPPVPRGNREQLLRLCCDSTARYATRLQQLTVDPRYGSDYSAMAEQAGWQHRQLLGLLGKENHR